MMKKIATTIALSALFMTGVMDSANAWIGTWNNKVTDNQLKSKYGESYKDQTKALYSDFNNVKGLFKKKAKEYKVQSNQDVKAVITLFDKIAAALEDIYQAEKGTILIESADKAINYYNQNKGAYSSAKRILGDNLQQFEEDFKNLSVPQSTNYVGDISSKVAEVFDIINEIKDQMTDKSAQPQQQTTVIVVPTATTTPSSSTSSSSDSNGNWMFKKAEAATPQTANVTPPASVITPVQVTPIVTVQPTTATTPATTLTVTPQTTTTTPAVTTVKAATPTTQATTTSSSSVSVQPQAATVQPVVTPTVTATPTTATTPVKVVTPAAQTTTTSAPVVKTVVSQPVVRQQAVSRGKGRKG